MQTALPVNMHMHAVVCSTRQRAPCGVTSRGILPRGALHAARHACLTSSAVSCRSRSGAHESLETASVPRTVGEAPPLFEAQPEVEVVPADTPLPAQPPATAAAAPGRGISRLQAPVLGLLAAAGAGLLGTGYDASGAAGIASAIGVLAGIVAFHELGHFTAARAQGIHVTKFSVGFGPALYSYQGKEVEYSLRAIPLGGYVGFPDDDPDSKFDKDDPDLLRNRPIAQRALVVSAGIIANIMFAYSVLLAQVATVGTPTLDFLPGVNAPAVIKGGAAYKAGVQPGDLILGVNGEALTPSPNAVKRVVDIIKDNPGRAVTLTIQRGGIDTKPFPLAVTPDLAARDNGGVIGVKLGAHAKVMHVFANGPIDAVKRAGFEFGRLLDQITSGLQQIVFNFGQVQDKISGPVAIVSVGAEVARTDRAGLFQFAALVNLNLAVVNALPLPALDGGYLALLALEAVRREKLDKVVEQSIMASGLLLLTGAGVFLILRDLSHLAG